MKAILFKQGVEVKRAPYPREDMALLEGQKSYIEWKLIVENAIPVYDRRTHSLVITEDNTDDPHPTYTHLKQYLITYSTAKKTNSAIAEQVNTSEGEANESVMNAKKRDKYILLGLGILIKIYEGGTPTAEQDEILTKLKAKAVNVWENKLEHDSKKVIANAGGVPDLDADWNTNEE